MHICSCVYVCKYWWKEMQEMIGVVASGEKNLETGWWWWRWDGGETFHCHVWKKCLRRTYIVLLKLDWILKCLSTTWFHFCFLSDDEFILQSRCSLDIMWVAARSQSSGCILLRLAIPFHQLHAVICWAEYCFQVWLWDLKVIWCSAQLWKGYDSREGIKDEIISNCWPKEKEFTEWRKEWIIRSETSLSLEGPPKFLLRKRKFLGWKRWEFKCLLWGWGLNSSVHFYAFSYATKAIV